MAFPETPEAKGLLRWGPLYVTPRLRVGTIGVDTNVFYTATDRQTDFTASGGPGLLFVLPAKSSALFSAEGGVDYTYFLRTESQRRWAGDAKGRLDFLGARAAAAIEGSYRRTYRRPSFEVDARIVEDRRQIRADAQTLLASRIELRGEVLATRLDVPPGQEFGGADLSRTLSRDTYLGRITFAYRLTLKTSLLVEGDYQADRFLRDPGRDADSNRAGGGFEIVSQTRLDGRAVGGVRSFRTLTEGVTRRAADILVPYVDIDLTYRFSQRTRLVAAYDRDLYYSAFDATTGLPVVHMESYRLRLDKGLSRALDIRLGAGLTKLRSDGLVRVESAQGDAVVAVRDDEAWEAGADLGYTFKQHLRIGVAVSYVERRSTIDDFGIEGLLFGGTVTFVP